MYSYRAASIRAVDQAGEYFDVDVFAQSADFDPSETDKLDYRVNRQPARQTSEGCFFVPGTGQVLRPVSKPRI